MSVALKRGDEEAAMRADGHASRAVERRALDRPHGTDWTKAAVDGVERHDEDAAGVVEGCKRRDSNVATSLSKLQKKKG